MELQVLRQTDDGLKRYEIVGQIARDQRMLLGDPLADAFGAAIYRERALLGLSRVLYVDSTGIEWLLRCHKRFQDQGGCLILHSASPTTARLLQMMRMDLVLNVAADENEARKKALDFVPKPKPEPASPQFHGNGHGSSDQGAP